MKKILFALLVAVAFLCPRAFAQQELDESNVDAVTVARAFALKSPTYFQVRWYGEVPVSNQWQRVSMVMIVRKSDFAITNLSINDVTVPLSKPLYGVPLGTAGIMRNVYVSVDARTKTGSHAGYGNLDRNMVTKDDNIVVTLVPNGVPQEIPVDESVSKEDLQEADLNIEGFHYGYGYGIQNGKFIVELPPVGGVYKYTLRRRSDGSVIGSGWIRPFKPTVTPSDAYTGVRYIGGVMGVDFELDNQPDDWKSFSVTQFDSPILTSAGTNVMGKVIYTDVGTGGIEVIVDGNVWVYIQQATASGDMPLLSLVDRSVVYEGGATTRVHTSILNAGKIVISVIPKSGSENRTWVNLHKFHTFPNSSDDDDGRGGRP
ncbi:MAG: hypothetical protein AAB381_03545 [Patescibacteria group bacterium]